MPLDEVPVAALENVAHSQNLPVWAVGMANLPTGFVYGFISTALGILLSARGVPVGKIATISSLAFSPTAWGCFLAPVVDVRFSRRAYGFSFAAIAAIALAVAVLSLGNLTRFAAALTVSTLAVVLYGAAVAGMAPDVISSDKYDAVGGWWNVANLGAAGLFASFTVVAARTLPAGVMAAALGLLVFAPTLLLLRFPRVARPEGTLRANFGAMLASTRRVLREGRVWVGLLLFLLPESCFALTNLFSSVGGNFRASERSVTALNGAGVAVACSLGCLLAIPLCRRLRRRSVYLATGAGAALIAVLMGLPPHTLPIYAFGLLAYNFCQGLNYTAFTALALEITGTRNAVAGTMMAILMASGNVPITLMTFVDGRAYDAHGLPGMMFADAGVSLVTLALLLATLPVIEKALGRARALPARL